MLDDLLLFLTIIFAAYGLIQLFNGLVMRLMRPTLPKDTCVLIPCQGNADNIELSVTYTKRIYCANKPYIILINRGLTDEGRKIVQRLCIEYDSVFLSDDSTLPLLLNDIGGADGRKGIIANRGNYSIDNIL